MKKLLTALLTLMMLCGTHAWAAPVSYQQAKQTANSFSCKPSKWLHQAR